MCLEILEPKHSGCGSQKGVFTRVHRLFLGSVPLNAQWQKRCDVGLSLSKASRQGPIQSLPCSLLLHLDLQSYKKNVSHNLDTAFAQ